MNTQSKIGTFILVVVLMLGLLSGCVSPVQAATAEVVAQAKNTCVTQGPQGLSLFNMQGSKPGDEMALDEPTTCYNADAANPRYWVVENPVDESRSVIPVDGVPQSILEKMMDVSTGSFGR